MPARIVVDLGFGDAGKGLVTDWLVRTTGARCVVRYCGGPQAGHNVVTAAGRHHTYAQVGAGSFVPGVRTVLGPRMLVHPTGLLVELRVLADKGVRPELEIDARCRLVTPYHQALNRLRERARGAARHGSCGVGVGEAVAHGLRHPEQSIFAEDLRDTSRVRQRMHAARESLRAEAPGDGPERAVFDDEGLVDRWIDAVAPVAPLVHDAPRIDPGAVFEGAQGVLLDESLGFHPHTTWSTTTDAWARELTADAEVYGVCRAWMVRHGPGPLPTEGVSLNNRMPEHNIENEWQGRVRVGHFDPTLIRYALAHVPVDHLVLTHLDGLARGDWRCAELEPDLPSPTSLIDQEALTARLAQRRPTLGAPLTTEPAVLSTIEATLGHRIALVSRGPTAAHVAQR